MSPLVTPKTRTFFAGLYSDQCAGETWQKDWRTRAKLSSDCDFDLGQETSRKSVQELLPILSWSKLILEFAKCSDLSLAPGTWAGGHAWPGHHIHNIQALGFLLIWPGPIFVVCWRRAHTCLGGTWWVICLFFDMSRCRIRPLLDFYHKIILWDNRRWDVSVFFSFERAPCVTAGIWKCQYRHQTYLLTDWCSCRHGRELFIHWCTWSPDRRCRGVLLEFGMIQLETCTKGSQSRCDMAHCRERAPELCRIKTPWKKCASMEPEVGFGSCIASLNSRTMICRSMHMYAWGCRVWHEGVGLTLKHMAFHWVALKACIYLYLIFGFLLFLY